MILTISSTVSVLKHTDRHQLCSGTGTWSISLLDLSLAFCYVWVIRVVALDSSPLFLRVFLSGDAILHLFSFVWFSASSLSCCRLFGLFLIIFRFGLGLLSFALCDHNLTAFSTSFLKLLPGTIARGPESAQQARRLLGWPSVNVPAVCSCFVLSCE